MDKLLAEAVAKHGVRLDPHDPAVVMVTLHRMVLEDAAKSVSADIRSAAKEFEEAANRIQGRLGTAIASRLKAALPQRGATLLWGPRAWLAIGLGSGVTLFSIGVAVGKWVLR